MVQSFYILCLLLAMLPLAQSSFRSGRNGCVTARHGSHLGRRIKSRGNKKFKLREKVGVLSCKNDLRTSMLNVDGLSDTALADVEDFVLRTKPDVVSLLETKRRVEEMCTDISIPGYECFEVRRSDVAGHRPGGGIACYTKRSDGLIIRQHSPEILLPHLEYVNNERVWLKVESLHTKTAILTVYIGCQYPDDRYAEWNEGIYWVLRQEVAKLRAEGYRIKFAGDMNGHIGSVPGQGVPGNNPDINLNGRRFLDFLSSCELRHINGECRVMGQIATKICQGLWTRQRGNSRSVIDYAGVSAEDVDSVLSMNIDDAGMMAGNSDHNWITLVLKDKFRRLRLLQTVKKKQKWNIAEDQDWTQFSLDVLAALPTASDCTGMSVDGLASAVVGALHSAGLSSIGLKTTRSKKSMRSKSLPPVLVRELEKKRELEKSWKSLVASKGTDIGVSVDDLAVAEEAWETQKSKVSKLFAELRGADNTKMLADRNAFWSAVSGKVKQSADISAVLADNGVLKCDPDDIRLEVEKHLCSAFQGSLESLCPGAVAPPVGVDSAVPGDHSYCVDPFPALSCVGDSQDIDRNPNNWLGRAFSMKEVKEFAKALLNNKACGHDRIPNEFVKNAPDHHFLLLSVLFNKMKEDNVFPVGWNRGRITLIHKRGLRVLLSNYRPITVLISLAGLYSKVLNGRLTNVVERHHLLGEVQGGFRKGRGAADSNFILHTIFWKARAQNESVHLGFLDVSKAYDSVNRELLWKKLASVGISGKFLDMLRTMYTGDSVDSVVNGVTSRSVFLKRGLRQSCSLSPMLFNLYISDIGHDLANTGEGFLLGNKLTVSGLLFADDIVVVAKTAAGLKKLLNLVNRHCEQLKLLVSEEKSQVVSPAADYWEIFGEDGLVASLKQVLEYKYLGLETFSSIFRTCATKQKKCVATAKRYMYACLYLGRSGSDLVRVSMATWENVAVPSILFGCDSILFSETRIAELECIQSRVAKRILGVSKNTSNVCAQTEIGFKPIRLLLCLQQLKFYFRVLRLPDSRWVKVALLEHLSGGWVSPYLTYICNLRTAVSLQDEPSSMLYLRKHMFQWALWRTNIFFNNTSLPCLEPLQSFKKEWYVCPSQHLATIASFKLANAGLGNKCPLPGKARMASCPKCPVPVPNSEEYLLFVCPSVQRTRVETGLDSFRTQCILRGFSTTKMFVLFVNGKDLSDDRLPLRDYFERGAAMSAMRKAWLGD